MLFEDSENDDTVGNLENSNKKETGSLTKTNNVSENLSNSNNGLVIKKNYKPNEVCDAEARAQVAQSSTSAPSNKVFLEPTQMSKLGAMVIIQEIKYTLKNSVVRN